MKPYVKMTVVLLAMFVAAPAFAGKIGFLDAEAAIAAVAEGKVQIQVLEDWTKPQRERVEALRQRGIELEDQLNAQRNIAAPDIIAKLEADLLVVSRQFEDAGRIFNRELDQKQNELLGGVAIKIGEMASEYGKANGFDAIFMLNAQPLAFLADGANVTEFVIRLYDEKYPVN